MNPRLKARIYKVPKNLAPMKAIVLRELDAADQREAARLANTRQALDDNEALTNRGAEMLRISVVAIQMEGQSAPQPVQQPYEAMDNWPFTWVRFVEDCFSHLNTLDPAEVGEAIASSQEWTGGMATSKNGPGDEIIEA